MPKVDIIGKSLCRSLIYPADVMIFNATTLAGIINNAPMEMGMLDRKATAHSHTMHRNSNPSQGRHSAEHISNPAKIDLSPLIVL